MKTRRRPMVLGVVWSLCMPWLIPTAPVAAQTGNCSGPGTFFDGPPSSTVLNGNFGAQARLEDPRQEIQLCTNPQSNTQSASAQWSALVSDQGIDVDIIQIGLLRCSPACGVPDDGYWHYFRTWGDLDHPPTAHDDGRYTSGNAQTHGVRIDTCSYGPCVGYYVSNVRIASFDAYNLNWYTGGNNMDPQYACETHDAGDSCGKTTDVFTFDPVQKQNTQGGAWVAAAISSPCLAHDAWHVCISVDSDTFETYSLAH